MLLSTIFFLGLLNWVFFLIGNVVIITGVIVAFQTAKKKAAKGVEMWENILLSVNYASAICSILVTLSALLLFIFSLLFHIAIIIWLLAILIISFVAIWLIFSLLLGFSAFLGHHFGTKKYIESKLVESMDHKKPNGSNPTPED